MFFDDLLDGMRRQMDAPLLDFLLFARPWGFALADVKGPVLVVHGDTDIIVPLSHAEYMAERLPNSELLVRPAESHLGGLDLAREIVDFVVERW
jgi:pimeloyl-ACP methyl ester carboxylesterase